MHDNEVLPRPHTCHKFLGRIFMLSNDTASGTAPSGQDLSVNGTHQTTAKSTHGGECHYVTASKTKLISMQPQYAVHPGTGPFRRAAISHAYRILQAVRSPKSYLCTLMSASWHTTSTPKKGLPQGWQSGQLARYRKSV